MWIFCFWSVQIREGVVARLSCVLSCPLRACGWGDRRPCESSHTRCRTWKRKQSCLIVRKFLIRLPFTFPLSGMGVYKWKNIIPGDELDEGRRKLNSGLGVEDGRSVVRQEVGGDDLLVGVTLLTSWKIVNKCSHFFSLFSSTFYICGLYYKCFTMVMYNLRP
jgi:hypothetical protein